MSIRRTYDNRSETFMARWIGEVVTPAHPWKGLPVRLRIGSFMADGTVRLYDADRHDDHVPAWTCELAQLRDAIAYGILLPDGPRVSTASPATLLQRLGRMFR